MIDLKDIEFEMARGKGPGGQHRNKTSSRVTATHVPTGISVVCDGRCQHANKKKAIKLLDQRVSELKNEQKAAKKKVRRDKAIKEEIVIRTYHYGRNTVKDHRTGIIAPLKEVLKGRIDLLKSKP